MLCTTAINTSNTITTQTGAAESYTSDMDNSCYYVITIAFNYRSLYDTKRDSIFNVLSKPDMSQIDLQHGTNN